MDVLRDSIPKQTQTVTAPVLLLLKVINQFSGALPTPAAASGCAPGQVSHDRTAQQPWQGHGCSSTTAPA